MDGINHFVNALAAVNRSQIKKSEAAFPHITTYIYTYDAMAWVNKWILPIEHSSDIGVKIYQMFRWAQVSVCHHVNVATTGSCISMGSRVCGDYAPQPIDPVVRVINTPTIGRHSPPFALSYRLTSERDLSTNISMRLAPLKQHHTARHVAPSS